MTRIQSTKVRKIRFQLGSIALALLLTLTGCQAFIGTTETPTSSPGPLEEGHINVAHDRLEHDGSFYNTGSIEFISPISSQNDTFNNVMLCLYDADGDVLNATNIGDLSGRFDYASYTISANEQPEYITFDHPGFYDYETMNQLTLVWTENDRYRRYHTSLRNVQDDFEYPRHNETGRCL